MGADVLWCSRRGGCVSITFCKDTTCRDRSGERVPWVRVRASSDGHSHGRCICIICPPIAHRRRRARKRRYRERRKGACSGVRRQASDAWIAANCSWRPWVRIQSLDGSACAGPTDLCGRIGARKGVSGCTDTGAVASGITRIGRCPAFLNGELVGPEWCFDLATGTRLSDTPCPEEGILERVHAGKSKIAEGILDRLVPSCVILPRRTAANARLTIKRSFISGATSNSVEIETAVVDS